MRSFFKYILLICLLTSCTSNSYKNEILKVDINKQKVFSNSPSIMVGEASMQRWWENIEDPLLNKYVDMLLADNMSLKQAAMRVLKAKEQMNVAGGNILPTIKVNSSHARGFANSTTLDKRIYNTDIGVDGAIAWEIDLFGKLNKTLDASKSSYEASIYDLEALEHSLIAELLRTRVEIAVNKEKLRLYKKMTSVQKQIYRITKDRYDNGIKGLQLADVYSAEEKYLQAKSMLSFSRTSLTNAVYKLEVLLGKTPGSSNILNESFPLISVPKDIAIYAPAKMLDRRPDLKASELRVRAGLANIDVAVANMYPSLNIAGAFGFSGDKTKDLLTAENLAGTIIASISATLFDGGVLKSNVRLKEAEAHELTYKYSEDVLEAFKEVELALKDDSETLSVVFDKKKSLEGVKAEEKISKGRYNKGITALNEYLMTKYRAYMSEVEYLQAQQDKWAARINLYLTLGGDWKPKQTKKDK